MINTEDRRVQKTRRLLKDAFISLVTEKGFEAVTIQQILDRANVGRSTFYMHFENKQALLHSCFEEFHDLFDKYSSGFADLGASDFILNLFKLAGRNAHLCKALLGKDDMTMFFNPVHEYIFKYVGDSIKAFVPNRQASLQTDMLVNYITSALIGTLRWWISSDMPCSAEDMDAFFRQTALRDIKRATV